MNEYLQKIVITFWVILIIGMLVPDFRIWFLNQHVFSFFLLLFSILSSLLLTPFVQKIAYKFNALDIPNERKVHATPTPLMGGLAIYLAFILSIFLSLHFFSEIKGVILAATLIVIMGVIDDVRGLSSVFRLAGQIIATIILIMFGITLNLFPDTLWGYTLDYLLTFISFISLCEIFCPSLNLIAVETIISTNLLLTNIPPCLGQ